MALGLADANPDETVQHRHSYSYKLKLAAIEWATNTYIQEKEDGGEDKLISRYAASARLRITLKMLRD
jgi:hypothetical protein